MNILLIDESFTFFTALFFEEAFVFNGCLGTALTTSGKL